MALADSMASVLAHFETAAGEAITYSQVTGGTFNTTTRTYTGTSTTNTAVTGIFVPFEEAEVDAANFIMGDMQCFISPTLLTAAGVTPGAGDVIVRGSTRYRVTPLESYVIAGSVVAYRLQVRGIE